MTPMICKKENTTPTILMPLLNKTQFFPNIQMVIQITVQYSNGSVIWMSGVWIPTVMGNSGYVHFFEYTYLLFIILSEEYTMNKPLGSE